MTPAMSAIPDDELRGRSAADSATSASTPAPAASVLAPKAPSPAASATSSRWTSPTARSITATAIITYDVEGQAATTFTIGNHETLNGLEKMTQLALHQLHRARCVHRCVHQHPPPRHRSSAIVNKAGDLRFNAGLFAGHSIDGTLRQRRLDRRGARRLFAADGRQPAALRREFPAPRVPEQQRRHDGQRVGQPSTNQLARYRARPFTQTDRRPLRRHRQLSPPRATISSASNLPASSSRCTSRPKASI